VLWYVLAICVVVAGAIAGPLLLGWPGAVLALVVCGPAAIWLVNRGMYPRD
jgi:hypothetical protein